MDTILASTLHDSANRLEGVIHDHVATIKEVFGQSYVVVTPTTRQKIVDALNKMGLRVLRGPETVIGAYKKALESALSDCPRRIFYCDFDRVLHWAKTYPHELTNVINSYPGHDFQLIGRSERAFKTHPETQSSTEYIANVISSRVLGFKETRDIISASWRLTPELSEKLLQIETGNTYGFYCQWPVEAWRQAVKPHYIEVEGLEWETPDRYGKEIEEKGYEAWLKDFQTPEEWGKRVQILADSVESISNYISYQTG